MLHLVMAGPLAAVALATFPNPKITLSNGVVMPQISLGTWQYNASAAATVSGVGDGGDVLFVCLGRFGVTQPVSPGALFRCRAIHASLSMTTQARVNGGHMHVVLLS
jgi:hypothetical protein